jgi:hypothetical protein
MADSKYTIVCPKCRKKLDVGRELRDARLRCKNCKTEFVGSTGPGGNAQQVVTAAAVKMQAPPANNAMSALGQAAQAEDGPRGSQASRQRKMAPRKSPAMAIMICLIGMTGMGVAVYVVMDRMSFGSQTETAVEVGDTKPVSALPEPVGGSTFDGITMSGGGEAASGGVLQQDAETTFARILSCNQVDASKAERVTFVGEYENTSKQVLKHVRIEVDIVDASGGKKTLMSEPYSLIPGYRTGWWSAASSLPAGSKVTVTATRSYYSADPDATLVGWAMRLPPLEPKVGGKTLLTLNVVGTINNPLEVPLTQLRVVIDFFRESGIYVGSMPGMIVGGRTMISGKGSAEFVTTLQVVEMKDTHEITVGKVRFVGRKAAR